MKLVIDDFAELHQVATDDVADRSADGFARVHQDSSDGTDLPDVPPPDDEDEDKDEE